ncbi:hypothetical protein [Mesorhizobium sp.]|uniref:hypothetical protein n=1 Tax=Mesorhizobium sp. TaxID=1871066 RepID=UPI001223F4B4|nr:hypothetical protein [Mesorhizobium sp.]TIS50556.1 MAG: hypothetical protein E5W96_09770 [Mesorhizobium sp.]
MGQPLPPGKLKTKAGPRHFPIEALQPNQFDGQTYLAVRKLLDFEGQMEKTAKPISTIDPAFATRPADGAGVFLVLPSSAMRQSGESSDGITHAVTATNCPAGP